MRIRRSKYLHDRGMSEDESTVCPICLSPWLSVLSSAMRLSYPGIYRNQHICQICKTTFFKIIVLSSSSPIKVFLYDFVIPDDKALEVLANTTAYENT